MMNITMSTVRMITTQCLMSEHSSDSISNRLAQPGKNTLQKKHITRLEDYNNIDLLCDRENLPTDLPESWPYKEPLHNKSGLINYGDKIITVMCQYIHKEFYILSRPSKAMTQGKFQNMQKEAYILSRPMLPDCGTPSLKPMANYSIASPLQLITQRTPGEKNLSQLPSTLGAQEMYQTRQELIRRQQNKPEKSYIELTPGTPVWVKHRQNTSWEPATVVSQCTTNSYWITQENGTEQPKVYRRTRSMLKIRCTLTEVEQTGYRNSQSTESEKTEFHTPAIPNTVRNYVEENSLKNISPYLVQLTLPTPDTYPQASAASFDSKSEEREEITDTPAPALEMTKEPGTCTPGSRKSTRKNFGKPASSFSDFYI